MTTLLIVSIVALSAVAAGAAPVAATTDESADDFEVTVDGPEAIGSDESAEFHVTVTTPDGEAAATDVVFEIGADEVIEEVTANTDGEGGATFVVESFALTDGEYEWSVSAENAQANGALTVGDVADENANGDDAGDDDTDADENGADDGETDDDDADGADESGADDDDADDAENGADDDDADDAENGADDDDADDAESGTDDADGMADSADDADDEGMPGFGVGIALVALLASAVLALRRRS
ncbi:PGF-CTERM sorting domain-containing protein [Natronorubrum texcoconense]|uniref:PGF-CTERM sorting domain-containing protein n=1 Tax=Natronorubrum texcoconense TaxID=1095776 RepID=UPI001FE03B2F|nr:PGF-CTERM sorting domain-containing protein [Natronorubrum texcoconense]